MNDRLKRAQRVNKKIFIKGRDLGREKIKNRCGISADDGDRHPLEKPSVLPGLQEVEILRPKCRSLKEAGLEARDATFTGI